MMTGGLIAALALGVCSAVAEPGFTIRLDVDLDGVKGGERLYEIPGCLTFVRRGGIRRFGRMTRARGITCRFGWRTGRVPSWRRTCRA